MYDPNTILELSPKGDKMVVCSHWCGILETFEIGADFKLLSTSYFAEPKYSGGKNGEGMTLADDLVWVFNDIYATDSQLYCAYDGESRALKKRDLYNKIAVFDWKGHPINEIITDKRIEQICLDQDGKFFALVENDLGESFLAKLP